MRPIFEARLKQLHGLGLSGPVIVRTIVEDIASMADEQVHFMGDELVAFQSLLSGTDPEAVKALVTFIVQSAKPAKTWIPPFDTLRASLRDQAERDQEAAQKADRARRAQAGADAAKTAADAMERARQAAYEEQRKAFGQFGFPPGWGQAAGDRNGQDAFKRMVDKANPAVEAAMQRLELKPGFTAADLNAAYRAKAKVAHPDTGGSNEAFEQLTKDRELLEKHAIQG